MNTMTHQSSWRSNILFWICALFKVVIMFLQGMHDIEVRIDMLTFWDLFRLFADADTNIRRYFRHLTAESIESNCWSINILACWLSTSWHTCRCRHKLLSKQTSLPCTKKQIISLSYLQNCFYLLLLLFLNGGIIYRPFWLVMMCMYDHIYSFSWHDWIFIKQLSWERMEKMRRYTKHHHCHFVTLSSSHKSDLHSPPNSCTINMG